MMGGDPLAGRIALDLKLEELDHWQGYQTSRPPHVEESQSNRTKTLTVARGAGIDTTGCNVVPEGTRWQSQRDDPHEAGQRPERFNPRTSCTRHAKEPTSFERVEAQAEAPKELEVKRRYESRKKRRLATEAFLAPSRLAPLVHQDHHHGALTWSFWLMGYPLIKCLSKRSSG
ncbi:hypothetical protein SISSUDRAFT_1076950 [Sistotremastrum suecicum HHB10207 ss-3]|uniref:Uncharacterized protein n=1 Tax=Sistotremastrum suecicum HHB10207 ss-3 TaxID=1314776 RepID=A0A166GY77_9AGAM|nr:hypothetical protein SISSUDRAFT_1076950 [Sistotremastrum suecicum HHB10207 ss-3]